MDWDRPQVPPAGFDHTQLPKRYLLGLQAVAAAQLDERARGAEPGGAGYRSGPTPARWIQEGDNKVLTIPDVVVFVPTYREPEPSRGAPLGCLALVAGAFLLFLGVLSLGRWPHAPFVLAAAAAAIVFGVLRARVDRRSTAAPIRRTGLYLFPDALLYVQPDGCVYAPKRHVGPIQCTRSEGVRSTWFYYPDDDGFLVAMPGFPGDVVALVQRWKNSGEVDASPADGS